MDITYAAICETGNREGENQDRIFTASEKDSGVFLVADGMGGHTGGAMASRCVQMEIGRVWAEMKRKSDAGMGLMEQLGKTALEKTNDRIFSGVQPGQLCGTTAVVLILGKEEAAVLGCGDSRCYCVERHLFFRRVRQLTVDDVWENSPEAERLGRKERKDHKNRGKLSRAVGTERKFGCFSGRQKLDRRNLFLLCSDGVYKNIPVRCFREILKKTFSGKLSLCASAELLRKEVYKAGAPDNLSLILIRAEQP